jgi:hypothetical protein
MYPFQSNVSSKYGAPMGRRSFAVSGKVHLVRVRLNGDYDSGGAYWGQGAPLWCAWNDEGEMYLRAPTREAAKAQLDNCEFYR